MCEPLSIAAAGVAVSAGGAVASYSASKKQDAYNRQVQAQNEQFRLDTMQHQNDVWKDDLKYSEDILAWAETEWNRQGEYATRAAEAVEKNTLAATGQLLLRQVEEDMAVIAQASDTRRTGQVARGQLAARDRGVEGNSVGAIIGDIMRQEGEALNVMAMNRSSSIRAINRAIVEADVQGDQQLASIQLKTYAPSQQIRTPAPVSPVNPAAPVSGPNVGALVTGLAGAAQGGFSNYNSMTKQEPAQTVQQLRSWAGSKLGI